MKNRWLLIAGLLAGATSLRAANVIPVETPPKVEDASHEVDKAAAHDASGDADKWAGKTKEPEKAKEVEKKPVPKEEAAPVPAKPVEVETPRPAKTPKTAAPAPPTRKVNLNEMTGKLESKSNDSKTLRLSVNGGYNVEFTYDKTTAIVNGGSPVAIDDLEYGDELIVRYAGKELQAVEIDRVKKASRPQ